MPLNSSTDVVVHGRSKKLKELQSASHPLHDVIMHDQLDQLFLA
jgi:hypothetical protein